MGVLDNGRVWTCTVTVYDLVFGNPAYNDSIEAGSPTTYTNTNIKSWKITDTMSANGDVAFGSTGSKALNLELIGLSSKTFGTGAIITVALGGAASKTWAFFADTVVWNAEYGTATQYSASVTAYDAMYYAAGKISSVALPSSIQALITSGKASITNCRTIAQYCIRHARYDLIRTRAAELYAETGFIKYDTYANMVDSTADDDYTSGKTMDDVCDDSTGKVTVGTLSGYSGDLSISNTLTGRTLLGRMAAMAGKRACCDNSSVSNVGKIVFENLITTSYSPITTGDVYDNGFVAEGKKKFTYFTTGKEDYGKKTSNGFSTMSINCPDMTSSKLASVASPYRNVEYEIGSVKFRGDPNLSSGMRLTAPDASGATHNMVCTKIVTCYDGGLYQQLYSEGKSDSDIEFENNAYAENAEQIVDEGGEGAANLLYYSETESPDKATISVGGKSVLTDASGIAITGDTSVSGDFTATTTGDWRAKVETANGIEIGSNDYSIQLTNNGVAIVRGMAYPSPAPTANTLIKGNIYSPDGILGARCLQSQYLYGHRMSFVERFGLANTNLGAYDNPSYIWYLRPQGSDTTQLINVIDHTFDLRSSVSGQTVKIKTDEFEASEVTVKNGYLYCDTIRSNYEDAHYVRCGEVYFNSTDSSAYCKATISIGADYIRMIRTNYDPNNFSSNTIRINLSATNINDLFSFL